MSDKLEISKETYDAFLKLAADHKELKARLAEYETNFDLIGSTLMKFTAALGLNTPDGSTIRPNILTGDEKPMGAIMKEITGLMGDFSMAEMPVVGKSYAEKIQKRFEFFGTLPAIIDFYQKHKNRHNG
jgi:hypothetical protein